MLRTLVSRRPLVTAALLGTLAGGGTLTVLAAPARAQAPVTINFNSLTVTDGSGVRYVDNCYQESGFQFTAVGLACNTPYTFATAGADDALLYTGSPALFLADPTATFVDVGRVGGGQFSMQSIGFSPFLGANTTVTLIGSLMGGGMISQTFNLLGTTAGLSTFAVNAGFTGLTSVRLSALNQYNEPLVQFDNLVFTPAASTVPEPMTIALVAGGLLGIGGIARRRQLAIAPRQS